MTQAERRPARRPRRTAAGMLAGLALLLAACGGGSGSGVDSGGTGVMPQSAANGPISGFGSVVVAGVHFDESTARIRDEDGRPLAAAQLQLGMTVQVQGAAVSNDAAGVPRAQALDIVAGEALVGPVTAVDTTACTATVLGQRVAATGATVLDASVPAAGSAACRLAALRAGAVLAVYASWDGARARWAASRLEVRSGVADYLIKAPVDQYDAAADVLTLRGQAVSLASLASRPADLSPGTVVRLHLRTAQVSGRWVATAAAGSAAALPAVPHMEVQGRVTQFTSAQRFSVDEVAVDASGASFPQGTAALGLGAKVEVTGRPQGSLLLASTVQVDGSDDQADAVVELEGPITAVDRAAQTFVVRGTTVSWAGSPAYEGGTAADLAVNRKVAVKGHLATSGQGVVADRIHLED